MFDRCSSMKKRIVNERVMMTERHRIVWMWLAGISARDISCECGASVSTVYRWIRRWQREGTLKARPNYGKRSWPTWKEGFLFPTSRQSQPQTIATYNNPCGLQFCCAPQIDCHVPMGVNPRSTTFQCDHIVQYDRGMKMKQAFFTPTSAKGYPIYNI